MTDTVNWSNYPQVHLKTHGRHFPIFYNHPISNTASPALSVTELPAVLSWPRQGEVFWGGCVASSSLCGECVRAREKKRSGRSVGSQKSHFNSSPCG